MQYSPKLKKAMDEIRKILVDNDIAAFVVLHTPGFSEYINHLQASHSCAKLEENGFRFRVKEAEVGKERAKAITEGTYNMMVHFAEVIGRHALMYLEGEKFLTDKFKGTHETGGHTSHNQQNN